MIIIIKPEKIGNINVSIYLVGKQITYYLTYSMHTNYATTVLQSHSALGKR